MDNIMQAKKKGMLQGIIKGLKGVGRGITELPGDIYRGIGSYMKMLNPSKEDMMKRYPKVQEMARRKNLGLDSTNK